MAISQYGNDYYGLSGDNKPIGTPLNGRKFTEMDTSKEYRYDAENQQWLQQNGDGGGGSSTLSGLTDVDISNPSNGQTLVYNPASGKWENGAGGGGLVVLQGSVNDDPFGIRLTTTYAELYTMLQNGPVVVNCPNFDGIDIFFAYMSSATLSEGAYSIAGNIVMGTIEAHGTASETVLFTLPY